MTDDEIIHRIREQDAAGELPTPGPPEAVAELETAVGHPMPPLLKRIYLEVADGGFGRWGEALSLTDTTHSFSDSGRLLEEYLGGAQSPTTPTTRRLLYRSWLNLRALFFRRRFFRPQPSPIATAPTGISHNMPNRIPAMKGMRSIGISHLNHRPRAGHPPNICG
ncbi:hypothetical protein ACFZAU_01090 [Streptomyces sp. NPDC008238]